MFRTPKRDTVSFVADVAVVAVVAFVDDVAALYDLNTEFALDITLRDEILVTLAELEANLEIENWEFNQVVQHIWTGERGISTLTAELDEMDTALYGAYWRLLSRLERFTFQPSFRCYVSDRFTVLSSIAPGKPSVQGECHVNSLPWIDTLMLCQESLTESESYTSQRLPA